jgi:hypothetical protein
LVGGIQLINKASLENKIESKSSDTIRDAKSTEKLVVDAITYAPPLNIRIIRIVATSLIGAIAIGLFTWLYVTASERNSYVDIEQYISEQYAAATPEDISDSAIEERAKQIFPDSEGLNLEAREDLINFARIVTLQFRESEISELRRDDSFIYFKADASEYSIILASADSYPYFDALIDSGKLDFNKYSIDELLNGSSE